MTKNNFTAIIVDDEEDAIELLAEKLKYLCRNITIVASHTVWHKALDDLRTQKPDLIFMDISMPGKNGLSILRLLPELDSEVIFITAYDDYARNAFEFSASGYILKPIDDEELNAAVSKATERAQNKKIAKLHSSNLATTLEVKIGIPNNKGIDYINVNDIIYIETFNKCTNVITKQNKILSSYNIGKFKTLLQGYMFYQVHRSYIININCIRRYESTGIIIMSDGTEIPIAKNEREDFLDLFDKITKHPDQNNYTK